MTASDRYNQQLIQVLHLDSAVVLKNISYGYLLVVNCHHLKTYTQSMFAIKIILNLAQKSVTNLRGPS